MPSYCCWYYYFHTSQQQIYWVKVRDLLLVQIRDHLQSTAAVPLRIHDSSIMTTVLFKFVFAFAPIANIYLL